jgi:hypothetical protein
VFNSPESTVYDLRYTGYRIQDIGYRIRDAGFKGELRAES